MTDLTALLDEMQARCDAARTDLPRLIAAVRAVLKTHRPETQYALSGACALEECDHEDECPGSPIVVCAHCYRVGQQAHRYAYEAGGVESVIYPCPTIAVVGIALEES